MHGLDRDYRRRLFFSLALTAALLLPVLLWAAGPARRFINLNRLSGTAEQRQKALAFIAARGDQDSTLARDVVARFDRMPADDLLQTYAVLDVTDPARRAGAPDGLIKNLHRFDHRGFVRAWTLLEAAGRGADPEVIAQAIDRVARSTPAQTTELYEQLSRHGSWRSPPVPPDLYLDWTDRRSRAATVDLRVQAARRVARLTARALSDPAVVNRAARQLDRLAADPEPAVRRAALRAAAALHRRGPQFPALARRLSQDPDPAVRYAAANVVDLLNGRTAPPMIVPRLNVNPARLSDHNRLAAWRAILQSPRTPAARDLWTATGRQPVGPDEPNTPLVYAAHHRLQHVDPDLVRRARAGSLDDAHWRLLLAEFEGALPGTVDLALPVPTPQLLRPAAVRAARQPSAAWLITLLRRDDAAGLRANACLAAAQRFDDATLDNLIDELMARPDAEGRSSAALLAGLRNRQTHRLRSLLDEDRRPAVRQAVLLGLWMQGQRPELDTRIAGWLGRSGVPEPLVMLALLHRGQWGPVLDRLLDPRQTTPRERTALLGGQRFADVLAHYLPPGAPRLSLWADADLFAAELGLLQAWRAVHAADEGG